MEVPQKYAFKVSTILVSALFESPPEAPFNISFAFLIPEDILKSLKSSVGDFKNKLNGEHIDTIKGINTFLNILYM